MCSGRCYVLILVLFLLINQNIQIVASFDDAYFKELWSSKNGSFYHVKTLQKGKTVLTALLTSIKVRSSAFHSSYNHLTVIVLVYNVCLDKTAMIVNETIINYHFLSMTLTITDYVYYI